MSKENINTLAIAWEHKYRVLQGKYNAETRELRQTLMLRDRQFREYHVDRLALEERLSKSEALTEGLRLSKKMWQRQAGVSLFVVSLLLVVVLLLWLALESVNHKLEKAEVTCEQVARDPNVLELPPTYIEVPRGTEVTEL